MKKPEQKLVEACAQGLLPIVEVLVEAGANIHAWSDFAIQIAAANGHLDIVKYLVEKGANIHAYDDDVVRYAAKNNHTEVVEYLEGLS